MSTDGDPPGGPPRDPPPSEPATEPAAVDPNAGPTSATDSPAFDPSAGPTTTTGAQPAVEPSAATAGTTAQLTFASDSDVRATDRMPGPAGDDTRALPQGSETPTAPDDSILPATYNEHALQDAVGVPRKKKKKAPTESLDEDGLPDEKRRSRKTMIVIGIALFLGLGIAALVLVGRINAQRYFLTCTTSQAIAEQGRAFPPWGSTPLPGSEWRPVVLPPNAQCKPEEVADRAHLERLFLDLLLERASSMLTTKSFLDAPVVVSGGPTAHPLDVVATQLEQALLLSRSPERGDQRKQVERLQGDVQYWRASLRLRDATVALTEASRQFDQAALARPMHVSDAGAWALFLRRLTEELHAGPNGVPAGFPPASSGFSPPPSSGDRPTAPAGSALPIEPPADNAPPSTPDAGVPTGGVLL